MKSFVRVGICILSAATLCLHAQSRRGPSQASAHSIYSTPPAMDLTPTPMPLVAPVFLQTDQVDSAITIVNGINWSVQGTITLRSQQGAVIATSTSTFQAHSSTVIKLKTLLAAAGSFAHSGSVTLEQDPAIKGPALLAQMSMVMHGGSQEAFLEEEFGMPTMHGSPELRGVASQTQNLPLIAITSVSDAPQTISASCIGENKAGKAALIDVPAHGTAVVHACNWNALVDDTLALSSALSQGQGLPALDHAITLKTDSVPGAFYAFGFALNGGLGEAQLQPLDFYDPGLLPSSTIAYVGVPAGAESSLLHANFSPVLTLANFTAQARSSTVTISDSSSGTPRQYVAAQVAVPAMSTKTVTLSGASGSGLLNTVLIKSDGGPGGVQAHLYAGRDSSGDRLELLAKDIRDDHNGGDHPWTLENGTESTLLLYNPTTTVQEFQVRVSGGSSSWVSLFHLAPEETRAVSIGDIVKKHIPDAVKHTLPATLLAGEVQWSTEFGASGLGRLLVTNEHAGLKRNFSCTTYYNLCSASFGPYNELDVLDGSIQSFSQIAVVACTEYCSNCCSQSSPSGTQLSFSTSWSGGNSAQTQVANSSNTQISLQGIALGTFSFEGFAQAGSCQSYPMGGGGTVAPTLTYTGQTASLNGTTQSVIVGQQIALTANYVLPSGVSVTSQSWSVPGTTTGGYTASADSGQNSAANFSNPATVFYWVDSSSSSRTVTYNLKLSDGTSTSSIVYFKVAGPQATISANILLPAIEGNSEPNEFLGIGNTAIGGNVPGISFLVNSSQSPSGGQYSFVQLITSYTDLRKDVQGSCTMNIGMGLDNVYPYANGTSTNDSPNLQLFASDDESTINFGATMYLMWQPSGSSSIPVPLGYVSWQWSADAIQNANVWSLQSKNSNASAFVANTTYPTWSTHVTNGSHPCN